MSPRVQHRVIDFVCHPARVGEDTAVVLGELEPDGWEVAAVHVGDDASHGVDVRRVTLVLKRPAFLGHDIELPEPASRCAVCGVDAIEHPKGPLASHEFQSI